MKPTSCKECGCARMRLGRPVPILLGMVSVPINVPGYACDDCGRAYPDEEYLSKLLAPMDAETAPT